MLHAVPIGNHGGDIDHLLIGPGGVWTLNTTKPGKKIRVSPTQVRVDGHVVPYLRNSEFKADRDRRMLTEQLGREPFVKAALVILTGTLVPDVTIKEMPANVVVLDRMDIPRVLRRSTQRLTRKGSGEGEIESYRLAKRYVQPDGSWVYPHLTVTGVRDANGTLLAFATQFLDMTGPVLARQAAQIAQEQLRAMLDSQLDPWILLDAVRDQGGIIVDFRYVDAHCGIAPTVPRTASSGRATLDGVPRAADVTKRTPPSQNACPVPQSTPMVYGLAHKP